MPIQIARREKRRRRIFSARVRFGDDLHQAGRAVFAEHFRHIRFSENTDRPRFIELVIAEIERRLYDISDAITSSRHAGKNARARNDMLCDGKSFPRVVEGRERVRVRHRRFPKAEHVHTVIAYIVRTYFGSPRIGRNAYALPLAHALPIAPKLAAGGGGTVFRIETEHEIEIEFVSDDGDGDARFVFFFAVVFDDEFPRAAVVRQGISVRIVARRTI